MKRFIIISLLAVMTLPMFACAGGGTDNYYLFSPFVGNNFKSRVEKICNDNWKAYLGSTEEYFWFNADEVIKAAQQKGDALMVSYIQNLQKYLDCVDIEQRKQYEWNYPTKEDIDGQKRTLQAVRTYALGKAKTKLRSQHALLYMRCNMMLGQHQENITFWEQTASQFIETVYKDMMKNIYAGALYKTGREAEAGELFAEMDDEESLMTQFYKKRSYLAISQHYKQNPTSKALPWLLKDFVNWLEFLAGKKKEAAQDILAAMKLEGTERMKDNARVLLLYITAAQAPQGEAFDDYLTDELEWLRQKQNEDGFFTDAENRLTNQVIMPHYKSDIVRLTAIARALYSSGSGFDLDTLNVGSTEKYLYYTNTPANNKLDKFLKANLHENDTTLSELIGTKYMRLCQWDKAIEWLKDIPVSFYNNNFSREYRYYSLLRHYNIEPWIKRQWLDTDEAWEKNVQWWKPVKLDFCKEMQMMEGSLHLLKGKAYDQRCYNLAVHYAQASIHGDCWWLLRSAKSCFDNVRANEVDLDLKAREMLQKAAMSSDPALKRKALFGMGYRELYGVVFFGESNPNLWREDVWDSEKGESVKKYNPSSPQYRAYQALYELTGDQPQEEYIRKCDEYEQFRKYYRQHR